MIAVGASAPDFALPDQDEQTRSLAELRGDGRLLLAFYPLDFSPVCSDQLSLYEPHCDEISRTGTTLVGISVDSPWAHRAFRERLGISTTLLADFHPKGEVTDAYGAYISERGHPNRSLVLIADGGEVAWVHESPSPLEVPPVELILGALQ